jgi:hypothetical protein
MILRVIYRLWSGALGAMAALCITFALISPALFPVPGIPQGLPLTVVQQQQAEQDRRLTVLESIQAEHRLTVMETSLEELRWQNRAILAALGGLLIDVAVRFSRRRAA